MDGCRIGTGEDRVNGGLAKSETMFQAGAQVDRPTGARFPANLIHDGSDEVTRLFPEPHGAGSARESAERKGDPSGLFGMATGAGQGSRHGDSGSAARFFYCAKSSRAERDLGLDNTCTVKYNTPEVSGGISWKEFNTALVQSLQKATGESQVKWFIGGCGENITGLCPLGSLSTTLTAISRITTSQILNSLKPLLTSEFIADANSGMENGGNRVMSAENSSPSTNQSGIYPARDGLNMDDVESVISKLLSWISAAENWNPARNIHSTVKPLDLMRYLCRLVTPPGGLVYDPFCGSGTTLIGAKLEGFAWVGSEMDPEYAEIARKRVDAVVFMRQMGLFDDVPGASRQAGLFDGGDHVD